MDGIDNRQAIQAEGLVRAGPQVITPQPEALEVWPEEFPHLLDYWHLILKHRWTVLTTLLIVFTTVVIGTLKQKRIYEGMILLEISPEEPAILSFSQVVGVGPGRDLPSYRETQYKVLESRTLAGRVVDEMKLYRHPEFYRSQLLFGLTERDPDKIPPPWDDRPIDRSSQAYLNSVRNFLRSVEVTPVRRSDLVEVSFYSRDPVLAAQIANKIADEYVDVNLEVKWDQTQKASVWLRDQLIGLKAKLEKSEEGLQAYAQANSIVFLSEKQNLVNVRLEQLQQEYTKAQADRYQKESLYSLVQAGQVQDLPGVLNNGLIQNLAARVADLEREYAQLTDTVKPEYPKAIQLKKQIDTMKGALTRSKEALAQNVVDDYRAGVARERYLAQAVEAQKQEVNDIAAKTITYNILKREVDTNRSLYDGLLQRLKEAQVSAGLRASNVRVVDKAEVPKGPKKPRVILNLALGFILGLGLGVGLAFFQEYLDNTLKTPDEVEHLLRLPSLGVVPTFPADRTSQDAGENVDALVRGKDGAGLPAIQSSPAAIEAYRSLRTSILLSAHPVPRLILLTSALPGEGKTTTLINLGVTLASLGSRVLVVDCDMRRPGLHRSAGVENKPGIVRCLTGRAGLEEAVLPVPGVENLSIIPCGPIPPNPAEILSSPTTGQLLRRLRSQFDYVLVDSPPLLSVADSRILSTLVDAVVLVTRAHQTPYEVVRRARSLLYSSGARILGVALNDVDIERDGFAFKYYYRYGYGYGFEGEKDSKGEDVPVGKGEA